MEKIRLTVKKGKKDEIRNGWIRINEKNRKGLTSNSLVKITNNSNKSMNVLRMLYGYDDDEKECIYLDEPTREKLGVSVNEEVIFNIFEFKNIKKIKYVCFYFNHPDNVLMFATRISFISLILGLISLLIAIFLK